MRCLVVVFGLHVVVEHIEDGAQPSGSSCCPAVSTPVRCFPYLIGCRLREVGQCRVCLSTSTLGRDASPVRDEGGSLMSVALTRTGSYIPNVNGPPQLPTVNPKTALFGISIALNPPQRMSLPLAQRRFLYFHYLHLALGANQGSHASSKVTFRAERRAQGQWIRSLSRLCCLLSMAWTLTHTLC